MQPTIPKLLRDLPRGWRIITVQLALLDVAKDEPPFGLSYEDLLEDFIVVHSDTLEISLELDWLPERSPAGRFTLSAVDFSSPEKLAESYVKPLRTFTTRSLQSGIEEMHKWMIEFSETHETAA